MSRIDKIVEHIQAKVASGELTVESAEAVLDKALAKYNVSNENTFNESTNDDYSLFDTINGINQYLREAEDSVDLDPDDSRVKTSSDGPDLPERTRTGEGVTGDIDSNSKESLLAMIKAAKENDKNAAIDAQGEDYKDTTPQANDLTENVINELKLRTYEKYESGEITKFEESKVLALLDVILTEGENCEDCKEKIDDAVDKIKDALEDKDIDAAKKILDELEAKKDECEKKDDSESDDEDEEVKESVRAEVNALKLEVYEAANTGLIDEATKEVFLDALDLDNYSVTTESEEESPIDIILDAYTENAISDIEALELLNEIL